MYFVSRFTNDTGSAWLETYVDLEIDMPKTYQDLVILGVGRGTGLIGFWVILFDRLYVKILLGL